MDRKFAKLKIGLICGGSSLERGISLNSARSVMDHLESEEVEIVPIYFDSKRKPYRVSKAQLYSNTPSDFDFKLQQAATPLNEETLVSLLKTTDIVFPVMHGPFGEDGEIQSFLEKHDLPFIGSKSEACKKAFDKFNANELIKRNGFFTLPSVVLKIYQSDHREILEKFFKENKIKRAVVKPASGGSSIGVFSVSNVSDALEKVELLFSKRMDTRVVVEPFAEGAEFTMIILENRFGLPVALPPTEIETDYTENQIFDFRRKYLPTRQVTWHCPPRFDKATIEKIQAQAEQLFAFFGMRDFSRFDGWVSPNGDIWFCDFNPVSGMEQNSFLFQQASRIGMTHSDILRHIVERACARYGIPFPKNIQKDGEKRKRVNIIMGGDNSEKQVSLMSGTNVWLKLRRSKKYQPQPYLLDPKGNVWHLPYHLCLNHTVEEITENCENYQNAKAKLGEFEERARLRLGLLEAKNEDEFFEPQKLTLKKFFDESDFIFIALHGGDGENGNFQKILTSKGVKFNGPDEKVSRLCMDKWDTSRFIDNLNIQGVTAILGKIVKTDMVYKFSDSDFRLFWRNIRKEFGSDTLIVKPRADGCTTGVVHLYSSNDLKKYVGLVVDKAPFVPKQTFEGQVDIIEMPPVPPSELLLEKFVETDTLRVKANKLKHQRKTGWVEITVGVVEMNGKITSLNPSITVVEGEVLTVEEKFQGGTGVNITPPPSNIIQPKILEKVKSRIAELAEKIGIRGYSRIDAFVNVQSGDLQIIEVNTLPGLTPSTVFYHQGLAETPPIFPRELIELLVQNKGF
jgi:D-alanine--D-alanine ligase